MCLRKEGTCGTSAQVGRSDAVEFGNDYSRKARPSAAPTESIAPALFESGDIYCY
jgi:hypothetical protein